MISNIDKYKKDLAGLISDGAQLLDAMKYECHPEQFEEALNKATKDKAKIRRFKKNIPSFNDHYQAWYSGSLAVINILLPHRLGDFIRLYEKPRGRKEILYGNYVIEDYLQGLTVTDSFSKKKIVSPAAAIPQFQQQLSILKSVQNRFESSLFEIKQLLQGDIFDSELEAAKELNKKGFSRGAGAMAGVVLEMHLNQVCDNHNLKSRKKNPTIADFNDLLKKNDIIEISTWRFIQHLGDLRNKCDHKKKSDPTQVEIDELIEGVEKISKTIF